MGIVSPFKLPTRSISMAAPEKPPEMISAGLTNTWMAQAWIKAERSTAAIVITRRIFLSFAEVLSVQVSFSNCLFFPYYPVLPPLCLYFSQIQEELPFPHRRQLLVTIKNRHTIKYCWHPHTKQKPVRHSFVLLTNVTIASFHSFVNLFVHFSKYLLFF